MIELYMFLETFQNLNFETLLNSFFDNFFLAFFSDIIFKLI